MFHEPRLTGGSDDAFRPFVHDTPARARLSVAFGYPLESSQPQIVASVHRPLIGLAEMSSAVPLSNFVGHDAATVTLR
jgi:hypothetical protein